MDTNFTILLANDPQAYRDALAAALRLLLPHATIVITEPNTLDDYVWQHSPRLVICSQITRVVETEVSTWVLLYPEGARSATVQRNGARTTMSEIDLEEILALISDQVDDSSALKSEPLPEITPPRTP
jgi:ABC-type Fe3+-hydroxamate transport system substrate-binding protein